MIRYRIEVRPVGAVAVECIKKGWPYTDADGREQFPQSHFDTELEALTFLLGCLEGVAAMDASVVKRARERLAEKGAELVESTANMEQVRRWVADAKVMAGPVCDVSRKAGP